MTPQFEVTDAISYKRFSSGRQARGNSVARQTDAAEDYATRYGLRIIDTYLDAGVSACNGANGEIGALRHLLDAAQAGKFKRNTPLLVESLDRLSRREVRHAQRLFNDIIDAGLVIVTLVDEQVYSAQSLDDEPHRLLFSIIIMMRGNDESKTKSKRSLDNRARERELARTARIPMNRVKAWVKVVGEGKNRKAVENHHARTVLRIYQDAALGYGAMKIAARLNDDEVKTFGGGVRWYPASVLNVLRDDAVLGIYQPHRYERLPGGRHRRVPEGDPIEGYYPVVVPASLVKRARDGLRDRLTARGRSGPQWANLVKGLGRCACCGGRVHHFERNPGYPYLRCYAATGVRGCKNHIGFPYKKFETLLYRVHELHAAIADMLPTAPDVSADRLAELQARAARLADRIDALVDDLESAPIGPARDAVKSRLAQRNEEQLQLGREIVEARRAVKANAEAILESYVDRYVKAKAKLGSNDPAERLEGRIQVSAEYRRIIDIFVLCPDRTIRLKLKPDNGYQVDYIFSPNRIMSISITLPDGRTTHARDLIVDRSVPMVDVEHAVVRWVHGMSQDLWAIVDTPRTELTAR